MASRKIPKSPDHLVILIRPPEQTNDEKTQFTTYFTVVVTSYPLPANVNITAKGDDIIGKIETAVISFMGPGTLLDHLKIIPPKSSTMVHFIVQIVIFASGILIVLRTGIVVRMII